MIDKKYTKPKWAVRQVKRETGLVEDICKHGVGHPNRVSQKELPEGYDIHGCDGCCSNDYQWKKAYPQLHAKVKKGD